MVELRDVQAELYDLAERIRAAQDVLSRTDIRSPLAGTVVDLRVHTQGGVIAPGAALMDIVPSNEKLVIDANAGWDAATSITAMERMADDNVGLFEQPTTNGDFHALAEVRRAISCPVMADDIVFDLPDALECIRHEACDVISLYPGKNGGIRKAWEIAELAAEHDVACSIGSNLELDVASAAMCHLVVACPNMQVETYPGDILGPDYHESSIAIEPLMIEGPVIEITDRPGLGVEVDWASLS